MHDGHTHDPHEPQSDHDAGPATPYEVLERALRTLLIDKGVITAEELSRSIDIMDSRTPALGADVVARAWLDDDFRRKLLADTRAALDEAGIDAGPAPEIKAIANEPGVHNVIVCTLCSCYPKMLLGIPPAWYKSIEYRSRAVRDPRGVLIEFGVELPEGTEVRVHDSTADLRYFVLPMRPDGTEGWDRERLAALVSRDCMIGTAIPSVT